MESNLLHTASKVYPIYWTKLYVKEVKFRKVGPGLDAFTVVLALNLLLQENYRQSCWPSETPESEAMEADFEADDLMTLLVTKRHRIQFRGRVIYQCS